jgi:cyclohexa-1,5-dienecarbonyl-CoA hydratase
MESPTEVLMDGPVRLESHEGGGIWKAMLNTPKANILDGEKCRGLADVFVRARENPDLKAILLCGEGPHFSFGASVQEHLPGQVAAMLHDFHQLFYRMLEARVVTLAAVRGQCLGGGMELAIFCNRIFASPDARLGQPEIVLGVLAPVASVMLPDRVGRSRAEDLLLSGKSMSAAEGLAIGLVDEMTEDPVAAAMDYAREHLLPKSASSLRIAMDAVRGGFAERFRKELERVETLYLEKLMATADAAEGLQAFLDKRPAAWKNA